MGWRPSPKWAWSAARRPSTYPPTLPAPTSPLPPYPSAIVWYVWLWTARCTLLGPALVHPWLPPVSPSPPVLRLGPQRAWHWLGLVPPGAPPSHTTLPSPLSASPLTRSKAWVLFPLPHDTIPWRRVMSPSNSHRLSTPRYRLHHWQLVFSCLNSTMFWSLESASCHQLGGDSPAT